MAEPVTVQYPSNYWEIIQIKGYDWDYFTKLNSSRVF